MTPTISTAELEEILAGCEGVTAGPWWNKPRYLEIGAQPLRDVSGAIVSKHVLARVSTVIVGGSERAFHNAAHIARLSPERVSAIVSELIERRKRDD